MIVAQEMMTVVIQSLVLYGWIVHGKHMNIGDTPFMLYAIK